MLKIVVLSTAVRSTIPRGAYRDFGWPARDDMHRRVSIENGKQHLLRNDIRRSHAVPLLRFPSLMSPLNLLPAYPFPSPQTPHAFPASDALIPCPMPTSSSCPSSPLHAPPLPPLAHPVLARTPLPSSHHMLLYLFLLILLLYLVISFFLILLLFLLHSFLLLLLHFLLHSFFHFLLLFSTSYSDPLLACSCF